MHDVHHHFSTLYVSSVLFAQIYLKQYRLALATLPVVPTETGTTSTAVVTRTTPWADTTLTSSRPSQWIGFWWTFTQWTIWTGKSRVTFATYTPSAVPSTVINCTRVWCTNAINTVLACVWCCKLRAYFIIISVVRIIISKLFLCLANAWPLQSFGQTERWQAAPAYPVAQEQVPDLRWWTPVGALYMVCARNMIVIGCWRCCPHAPLFGQVRSEQSAPVHAGTGVDPPSKCVKQRQLSLTVPVEVEAVWHVPWPEQPFGQ